MKQIDISVNVCTYNRAEMLRGALKSLICQETDGKFSYEIVVIDNLSTDSTKAVVDQVSKNCMVSVKYILEKDKGVAQARNRGVKVSKGAWIAFFDDDELAEADWLKQLYNVSLKTGSQCVGGSVHLDMTAEQLQGLGRICCKALREFRICDEVRRYRGKELPGSNNMLVARAVFDSIGFFDCSMLRGGSDHDFATRARLAGFDMWYTPKAVVHHRIPPRCLTPEYFRYNDLKSGASLAFSDFKYKGPSKMIFFCIARIGQALLINLLLLFFGWIRQDKGEVLGRKSLLWRAEGYTRQTLSLVAPKIFPQHRFFASIDFRKGRGIGNCS